MPFFEVDNKPDESQSASPTWADYGELAKSSVQSAGAQALGAGRYISQAVGDKAGARVFGAAEQQQNLNKEDTLDELSPEGRKRLESSVTDGAFWSHPISAGALKTTGMSAQLMAGLLPGAVVGGVFAGTLTAAVAGGAINSASAIDDIYSATDKLDDKELQKQSAVYKGMRTTMDEPEARGALQQEMLGVKPALNFLIGAAAAGVGPAGTLARGGVLGAAERGVLGRTAVGAGEGFGIGAAQSGVAGASQQVAEMEGGIRKEFDDNALVKSTLEGGLLSAVMAAPISALSKGEQARETSRRRSTPAEEAAPEVTTPEVTSGVKLPEVKTSTAGVGTPSTAPIAVDPSASQPIKPAGTGANAPPAGSSRPEVRYDKPKGNTSEPEPKGTEPARSIQAEVVGPLEPDTAVKDALVPKMEQPGNEGGPKVTSDVTQAEQAGSETGTGNQATGGTQNSGPRILPDLTQEAQPGVKLPGLEVPRETGTKNYTQEELAKRAADEEHAAHLVSKHVPQPEEADHAHSDRTINKAAREKVLTRAKAIVDEANTKGTKIPQRLKGEISPAMVILREAQDLVKASQRKSGALKKDYDRFVERENSVRAGKHEEVLSERKTEGDTAKRVVQDEENEGNNVGGVTLDTGSEKRRVIDKSGNVQVVEGAKAASGVRQIKLTPEELAKYAQIPALAKSNVPKRPQEGVPRLRESVRESAPRSGDVTREGNGGKSVHTTVGALLSKLDTEHLEGVPKAIATQVRQQFSRLIGDTPVHIVPHEAMVEWGGKNGYSNGVEGLYYSGSLHPSGKPAIYLSDEIMNARGDRPNAYGNGMGKKGTQLLLHEAAHAAMQNAIENDPRVKANIRRMMDEVQTHHEADPNALYQLDYAFTNEHEFMSEAFGNPDVQNILAETPMSKALAKELGIDKPTSVWAGWVKTVLDQIQKIIGKLPGAVDGPKMIEGVLRTGNKLMDAKRLERVNERRAEQGLGGLKPLPRISDVADALMGGSESGHEAIRKAAEHPIDAVLGIVRRASDQPGATKLLHNVVNALTSNDQLRQRIEKLVPQSRKIFDTIEKQGVYANDIKKTGTRLASELVALQKKYPGAFQKWSELVNSQTMVGADASEVLGAGRNSHLGLSKANLDKQAKGNLSPHDLPMNQWEARLAHPELAKEFKTLPKEFKAAQDKLFKFFEDSQRDMAKEHVSNLLRASGVPEAHVSSKADKHLSEKSTQAVKDQLKADYGEDIAKQILSAKKLGGLEGPYSPLIRHGDHVVAGKYKLQEPTAADGLVNKVSDSKFEFKTREQAHRFATKTGLGFDVDKVYYDPNTNKRTTKEGGISHTGGPEERYEVTVNRKHVEFAEGKKAALARHEELKKSGLVDNAYVEEKQNYINRGEELGAGSVRTILKQLEKSDAYNRMSPTEQADARSAVENAALVTLAGNRVQSRRLPRRNVQGASDDMVRNLMTYNDSSSNYRAKVKHRPQIEAHIKEMMEHVEATRGENGGDNTARSQAANEVISRARAQNPDDYTGNYTKFARILNTWSYVDRMIRVSHLLLHQTHLPMITMPYLAGRHGAGASYGMMAKTWRSLGKDVYTAGGGDFVKSIANALHEGTDFTKLVKKRLLDASDYAGVSSMLDELGDIGLIHPQAGMEIQKFHDTGTGVLANINNAINRIDTVFRHATNATEAINRYVGAISAYRLEFAKLRKSGLAEDAAHAQATEYARNTIANTQGFYSSTNAAPAFKNKIARPFLQFKQFPQMIYHLLIQTGIKAFKGETKEARVQAALSLASILAASTAMTGLAGGLPLEVAKIGGLLSKGLGLTSGDWTDVEQAVEEQMVKAFGKSGAGIVMHGVGQLSGADLHHRLGYNSLLTFGMPDKVDTDHMRGFLFQAAMGAPGGLAEDALKGLSKMMSGDVVEGALQATPLQALRDVYKAGAGGGTKPDAYKYSSAYERIVRAMGFTPSGEAEFYNRKNEMFNAKQEYYDARREFEKKWGAAKPADRAKLWGKVETWNKTLPKESRITRSELDKYATNKTKNEASGKRYMGLSFDKRTKFIADRDKELH